MAKSSIELSESCRQTESLRAQDAVFRFLPRSLREFLSDLCGKSCSVLIYSRGNHLRERSQTIKVPHSLSDLKQQGRQR